MAQCRSLQGWMKSDRLLMPLKDTANFFFGCILEWRLADILHGFVMKKEQGLFLLFQFMIPYVITQ